MTTPLSSECFCANMRKASRALSKLYNSALEECGLPSTQYSLLSHLKRLGPVSFTALSKDIRLERTTLVRNLRLLETQGYVEITGNTRPNPHFIRLTPAGEALQARGKRYWNNAQATVRDMLSDEERLVLEKILLKFISLPDPGREIRP